VLLSTASPASFVPVPGLPDAVVAGFTRRLDLACSDRQPDVQAVASWGQVLQLAGIRDVALVSQVHGDGLLEARAPTGALRTLGEADAVWTRVPGLAVAVRVADCVPVLLHGAGFVAAIHAGWRGVAARIVPKTIAALSVECEVAPSEMQAVLGPAICGRHYEVGPEVAAALEDAGIPAAHFVVPDRGERAHVDGSCAVAWQLARAGVRHVAHQRACTWEDPALHSWRRDGPRAGRIAGLIALREA
jgi:YfiH family protein